MTRNLGGENPSSPDIDNLINQYIFKEIYSYRKALYVEEIGEQVAEYFAPFIDQKKPYLIRYRVILALLHIMYGEFLFAKKHEPGDGKAIPLILQSFQDSKQLIRNTVVFWAAKDLPVFIERNLKYSKRVKAKNNISLLINAVEKEAPDIARKLQQDMDTFKRKYQ
jgi:hypothetical protein